MLEIKNIQKYYKTKNEKIHALKKINLKFEQRGLVVLTGKSGSGKSTLLNLIGGLDYYDSGEMIIKGIKTHQFSHQSLDAYRNTYVGFVFQEFYLINSLSVYDNLSISLELQNYSKDKIDYKIDEILKQVDLLEYKESKPNELSGGQKQRIALARVLIKDPHIILADEPTGNLDSETGTIIFELLKKLSKTKLVIMVTHDIEFAHLYGDRIIELKDGEVINDYLNEHKDENEVIYDGHNDIKHIIKISKGQKISNYLINYINNILIESEEKLYITIEKDTVLKNITRKQNEKKFEMIDSKNEPFNLKKTKLPFKYAFKFALNSLFKKKFRLILMLCLIIFSLIFIGVATNLTLYNPYKATNLTFSKMSITTLPLRKQELVCESNETDCTYIDSFESYDVEDVSYFNIKYPSIKFIKTYDKEVSIEQLVSNDPTLNSYYQVQGFGSVTILDEDQNIFRLYDGQYPSTNEIAITDYMAEMFIYHEVFPDVDEFSDLINKELMIFDSPVRISGIIKTDIDKFSSYKDSTNKPREFIYYRSQGKYRQLYMTQSTYTILNSIGPLNINVDFNFIDQSYYGKVSGIKTEYHNYLLGRLPEKDDEIVINQSTFSDLGFSTDNINHYLENTIELTFLDYSYTYTIVGIINDNQEVTVPFNFMFYDKEHTRIIDLYNEIEASVVLGDDEKENTQFLSDLNSHGYRHDTFYSDEIYSIQDSIHLFKLLFYIIGLVFLIFGSVLIFTFMLFSIKEKQKDIGILRAIGAKGIDVGKILMIEGIIIALISSIIASMVVMILTRNINDSLIKELNLNLVVLYHHPLSILIIIFTTILIITVSSFIPIKKLILMRPIKVIKGIG